MSKVITLHENDISKYVFDDEQDLNEFIDPYFDLSISLVYEDVTDVPGDWEPDKYTYDGTTWTLVP